MKFIRNSIIVSLLLIGSWWLILDRYPLISVPQHQWQSNISISEHFLFDDEVNEYVILGSSLAKKLHMKSLSEFTNLSMEGLSIWDGLSLIHLKGKFPKVVFIEINHLLRTENKAFQEIMFSPVALWLKDASLIFRSDKQPIALVSKMISYPLFKKGLSPSSKAKIEGDKSVNSKAKDRFINLKRVEYEKSISQFELNFQLSKLNLALNELKEKDVKVVFFEMPIEKSLVNLTFAKTIREEITKRFPFISFIRIPDNVQNYNTTDGIHLDPESAISYTNYFYLKSKLFIDP